MPSCPVADVGTPISPTPPATCAWLHPRAPGDASRPLPGRTSDRKRPPPSRAPELEGRSAPPPSSPAAGVGPGSVSTYRGVSWNEALGQWQTRVKVNCQRVTLGFYSDQEAAARAFDQAAVYLNIRGRWAHRAEDRKS